MFDPICLSVSVENITRGKAEERERKRKTRKTRKEEYGGFARHELGVKRSLLRAIRQNRHHFRGITVIDGELDGIAPFPNVHQARKRAGNDRRVIVAK